MEQQPYERAGKHDSYGIFGVNYSERPSTATEDTNESTYGM